MGEKRATHVGDPSEDARVEADVILRDVKPTLDEDIALESTPVVCESNQNDISIRLPFTFYSSSTNDSPSIR